MVQVTGTTRPGGRTARTREVVHTAVRDILSETAGATPSIADVAARSGVNAATIYRRWRSAAALVLDVAVVDLAEHAPINATGDLSADLSTWGRALAEDVSRPEGLRFFRAILAAATDPAVGVDGARELIEPRLQQFQDVLDASNAPELTPTDVFELMLAPTYLAAMFRSSGQPFGATDIDRLVGNVIAVRDHRRKHPQESAVHSHVMPTVDPESGS